MPDNATLDISKCPHFNAFDPLTIEQIADPFPVLAEAREEAPIFYSPKLDLWVLTRRDDVLAVYKDMATFSNGEAHQPLIAKPQSVIDRAGPDYILPVDDILNSIDPPRHMPMKRTMTTVFNRQIAGIEGWLSEQAHRLIDRFVDAGETDLVHSFNWPFTIGTVSHLIGVGEEDGKRFKEWAENWFELTGSTQLTPDRVEACWMGFVDFEEYIFDLVRQRRESPQDDLISKLLERQQEGATMTDRQIVTNMIGLVAAGADTTANSIGQMMYLLLTNPDQLALIRKDPTMRGPMIEEVLRLRGPVRGLIRVTTREVELGGITLPKGAKIYLHIGAASRDPAVFADPDRFDVTRPNVQRHMAFGGMSRLCLGAPIARLEMRQALDALLERLPGLELEPGHEPLHYTESIIVPSLKTLRLRWDASAARTARAA